VFEHWGTTPAERAAHYPCQDELPGEVLLTRGVDLAAPPEVGYRWLCQLRVAPYSYDWIDNFGRRSPQQLIPGLEHLEVGQRICRVFTLRSFEPSRSITFTGLGVAISYVVTPGRLVGALSLRKRTLLTTPLALGDLVMMRRQLLNLARLAEGSA
jgi:hypothetical protein